MMHLEALSRLSFIEQGVIVSLLPHEGGDLDF